MFVVYTGNNAAHQDYTGLCSEGTFEVLALMPEPPILNSDGTKGLTMEGAVRYEPVDTDLLPKGNIDAGNG